MLWSTPHALATNSPMPELAPVTKITFPANLLDDDIGAALSACCYQHLWKDRDLKLYVDHRESIPTHSIHTLSTVNPYHYQTNRILPLELLILVETKK